MARLASSHRPGFYPQPNEWTCGPFALKHAMVALGRACDANEIAQTARTHWWSGTNEIRLARAARAFDCDLVLERSSDAEEARRRLVKHLREQVPVLLCVDEWTHWITVVGVEEGRFLVIDSEQDPVLTIHTWPQLRSRWHYDDVDHDRERPPVLYDLHAIMPRFRSLVKADFSVDRIKALRRPSNRSLALYWNEYLEDLLAICKPSSDRIVDPLSMGEFLRRHQELIVSRVVFWHGDIDREEIAKILKNFRFVSETYGLVIPAASTRRAAADLAILVTMWVIAVRGIDDMYGMGLGSVGGRQGLRRSLTRQAERLNKVVRRRPSKAT
jgi:hypothetical protein